MTESSKYSSLRCNALHGDTDRYPHPVHVVQSLDSSRLIYPTIVLPLRVLFFTAKNRGMEDTRAPVLVKATETPTRSKGGRPKGSPNKITQDTREVFKVALQCLAPKLQAAIEQVMEEDPARGADLLLRLSERFVPVLSRRELVGEDGGAIAVQIKIDTAE